jgi:hypothetical protein
MTAEEIKKYLIDNYGSVKQEHNVEAMSYACNKIAKNHEVNAKDVFHFMVEQQPINSLMTHSYGFNTASGRELRARFEGWYQEYVINNE